MPDLPPAFALFAAAFWLQVPAVLLFVAYAFKPLRGLSLVATLSLGASLGCLLLFMLLLGGSAGRIPLASGFEALAFWGLCLGALVLWVEWRHRLGLLGAFLAPLSGLTLLMGFRFIKVASEPAPGLGDAWLLSHVALAMFAYACFTVAAGVAGAYLVQERQLKAKRLDSLFYQLPPLQELEHLLAMLAKVGTGALALGLHFGFVWRLRLDRTLGLDDPKVIFGFTVCLAYAALLKSRRALKGRRFAWACLAFFFAVFVGHYLVNVYLGGHGFLRAPGA